MNVRMLAPGNVALQTRTVNGRVYAATTAGQEFDIVDCDAAVLSSNGWTWVAPSGTTAQRPVGTLGQYAVVHGAKFFDVTLGYVIVYAGGAWRNPSTGAAV